MNKTLLSFGHGYTARALADLLIPRGWRIIGTTRSSDKAEAISQSGVEPLIWPGSDISKSLSEASHILVSAGPQDGKDPVLAAIRAEIESIATQVSWVGYLSTTGVYGNHDGAWVDEATPLTPSTDRGAARVAAEADWQSIEGLPLHIFRLAGIYGPGRGPFAKVRSGTARRIIKNGQVFSRTHVEDIAQVVAASIAKPDPGGIYNVCDDDPAPPEDVIAYAAQLLGLPVPPAVAIEDAQMSPMARSSYAESKRVRNDRIKTDLGVTLKYPTYKEGLSALLETD